MLQEIVTLRLGPVNAHILPAEEGSVLVDAGMPGSGERIGDALARRGMDLREVRLILVTHVHHDHVGGLWEVREKSAAPVMVHQAEASLLEQGTVVYPPGTHRLGRAIMALVPLVSRGNRFHPCPVDLPIGEETDLRPFGLAGRAIPTPGHTAGSISVLLDSGEAFVGDLCFNVLPFGRGPILPPFGDDARVIRESWGLLVRMGARTIYPGHGSPFDAEVLRRALSA